MKDTLDMPAGVPPVGLDHSERAILAGWMLLAVGALAAAGLLALLLPTLRSPGAEHWFPFPIDSFFQVTLVTHVVMAFVVWFLAMLGGLAAMVRPGGIASRTGLVLAVTGTALILFPALGNLGEPLLVDYVPVLNSPLYYSGLALLAIGVALPVAHLLARPPRWGLSLTLGTGTAGVLFLLALLCCALAYFSLPQGSRFGTNDEAIFWGCGHLLQLVFTTLLLTIWQTLGEQLFEKPPLTFPQWRLVCALMVISGLPGPVFYSIWPAADADLRVAFTKLYLIGLPLPVVVMSGGLVRRLVTSRPQWRSPAYLAVLLSFLLFSAGGVFGLFADGFDTRTPGHYHAELIAVSIGLMGLFFAVVMPTLCRGGRNGKALLSLFWFLAIGQFIACCGMFLAGSQGVGRKIAGAAQSLDNPAKIIGMSLNHGGAGIASIGGIIFVYLALTRLLSRTPKAEARTPRQGE
jgi:hypothetical protein